MFIASKASRGQGSAIRSAAENGEMDRERREFIRAAAISFASVAESEGGCGAPGQRYSEESCWAFAKRLWEAKPEDC